MIHTHAEEESRIGVLHHRCIGVGLSCMFWAPKHTLLFRWRSKPWWDGTRAFRRYTRHVYSRLPRREGGSL